MFAIWLLRWPIAGLHIAIFGSAFGYYGLMRLAGWLTQNPQFFETTQRLPLVVMILLAVIAVTGLIAAHWRAANDAGLTGLCLATTLCAGILFSMVALVYGHVAMSSYGVPLPSISWMLDTIIHGLRHVPLLEKWPKLNDHKDVLANSDLANPSTYLAIGGWMIMTVWFVWNIAMLTAITLIGAVGLYRVIRPPKVATVPLQRPACAASLAIIQNIIWKLVICPLSIFVILMTDQGKAGQPPGKCVGCSWAIDGTFGIDDILARMVIISMWNSVLLCGIAIIVWYLSHHRSLLCDREKSTLLKGVGSVPRLIVDPRLLVVLLASNVLTFLVYCLLFTSLGQTLFHVDAFKTVDTTWSRETFKQFWGFLFASTTVLGLILPYILAYFLRASRGVLHIARDVVDHQYTPRLSFARWMLPKGSRREGIHPRRVRLQNRLHALMSEVIKPGNFDRLVFVTHSQGTVIMHDYLTSKRDEAELRDVKHIDVITLASPLSHIYQHYFHDYERATRPAARLSPRLRSWTNLWRIDDPIGQRVDIVLDDFISNVALGPGGHVNYWKEDEVCEAILNAIDPARAKASSSVASPQEQQARTPAGPRLFEVTS